MRKMHLSFTMRGLILGTALAAPIMPVMAQSADEGIVVTGRYGRVPAEAGSASQTVSYADLDLSKAWARDELRHRISLTARYLCDKLGESDATDPVTPSCRDAAARDAMQRVGTLEAHFAPRGTAWVGGPKWAAPYPNDWVKRYPDDGYAGYNGY